MRILFVTPYPLSRIRSRSYGFVTQLARQHDVTALALCTGQTDTEEMRDLQREGLSTTVIYEKSGSSYLRSLLALGTRQPFQVAYAASPALRTVMDAYLVSGRFNLMHVESARALGALPAKLPIPCVWDAVDCISHLYEQGAKVGATPFMRTLGGNEARRMQTYEREHLHRFRYVLVTSERERLALLKIADSASEEQRKAAEIITLPHGIDQHYYQPYTGPRLSNTLVFSGKMSFHANVAGVAQLIEHVLPLVWEKRPAVRLVIAGSEPPPAIQRLAARDPRIELTGHVSDLRPYIAQAQISVSPLPYAVGLQNKALEAMALGTPAIVSTHVADGLQPMARSALLIADSGGDFAAAILRLLDNRPLWHRLAEEGVAYIAAHHNWEHIIQQLTTIYNRALEGSSHRSLLSYTPDLVKGNT